MKRAIPSALFWLLALMALLVSGTANAQTASTNAPVHKVDGSFIREWLFLGPFSSRDMEVDLLAEVGGEGGVRPKEGDSVQTRDGRRLVWTRFRSERDVIDLDRVFGIQQWAMAYAYCEIDSDALVETDVLAPASRTALLWINGNKVGETPPAPERRDVLNGALPIRLTKGRNSCLLKLRSDAQPPWTFAFQPMHPDRAKAEFHLTDETRSPIGNALVQVYESGALVARVVTDSAGKADICFDPVGGPYDFQFTSGELGTWIHRITLRPGERRPIDAELTNAVSITGRTLTMSRAPQTSIVVQAIRVPDPSDPVGRETPHPRRSTRNRGPSFTWDPQLNNQEHGQAQSLLPMPEFSATTLSDTNGNFRLVNLRPGLYRLRAHGSSGYVYPEGASDLDLAKPIEVRSGQTHHGVEFVFPSARQGAWTQYSIRDGLVDLVVSRAHRTPDGMLWVGTDQRTLHAYDGVEFKMFSGPQIPGTFIQALEHDANGTLWIGTDMGISWMSDGRIHTPEFVDPLSLKTVRSIVTDPDGTVWFSTTGGLGKFDGREVTQLTLQDGLPSNHIGALVRTADGALWMSTGRGLARFDGGSFSEPVVLNAIRSPAWERLRQVRDGSIWLCSPTDAAGAFRYDGQTISRLGEGEGLPSDKVYDMAQTSDGALWFGTQDGLSRFDGKTIVNYSAPGGFAARDLRDIHVDSDDVLWCAFLNGVGRFDPKTFWGLTKDDGLSNKQQATPGVFAIESDPDGGHLIGTEWGGVRRLSGDGAQLSTNDVILEDSYVRHIQRNPDGTLWFGASEGIYKQSGGQLTKVLNRNWIIALNSDNPSELWFGHGWIGGGLSRYNLQSGVETIFTKTEGLPDDNVWALERGQDGSIWIGAASGLARYKDGTVENIGEKLGIPLTAVSSLRADADDTLWIGSGSGLHLLRGTNVVSITSVNGASIGGVWSSARTADGTIWMGTDKHGLLGFDGQALTMIDKRDGLLGNQVFSIRPEEDGSLLIGLLDAGLSRYRRTKSPPSVRVIGVKLDGQTFSRMAALPSTESGRQINVQYREIDLKTHADKRQFKYSVRGPSGNLLFSGVTKDRQFEWTPRKGGAYAFEVQAIDRDLNYSVPARIALRVIVPWHANPFILVPSGLVILALIVWGFVARSLYVRKSREAVLLRERARISRDLHDHLGARLTHLAMVSEMVGQQIDQPASIQTLAARLSESARELTSTMGEVIWATDPEKDTLQSFALFVTRYAERFFGDTNVRLRFDIPTELPPIVLPAETRNSLFMVAKEAMTNVAKYAQASELRIKLDFVDRELHLIIADNGRGFSTSDVATNSAGNGLVNMRKRLEDLGGQLWVQSSVGHGAQIQARLRLRKK